MKSFQQLYKVGCDIRGENPHAISMYEELDQLLRYIRTHPEISFVEFKRGLSSDRVCVVVPYYLFPEKRLPPDDTIDGVPVKYACPVSDKYISLILDQMKDSYGVEFMGGEKNLRSWKIGRLSKVVDLGWSEFCRQYMENL